LNVKILTLSFWGLVLNPTHGKACQRRFSALKSLWFWGGGQCSAANQTTKARSIQPRYQVNSMPAQQQTTVVAAFAAKLSG
jgi:hypothetical protein